MSLQSIAAYLLSHGLRSPADDRGGPVWRHRRHLGQSPQCQETSSHRNLRTSSSSTAAALDSSPHPVGTAPRKSTASPSHGGPIHLFFAVRSKRDSTHPLPGHQELEKPPAEQADDHGAEDTPLAAPHPRTIGSPGQGDEGRVDGPALARASVSPGLNPQGGWRFMQFDAEKKKLIPQGQPPIPMDKMKEWIQELHELAQNPNQILRLKALKRQTTNPQNQQICPWLLQVTGCNNRLWELLHSLSHSGIWLLLGTRRLFNPFSPRGNTMPLPWKPPALRVCGCLG